jgi:glycerol dehydrogenase-like iron-containing ADH family enzyme
MRQQYFSIIKNLCRIKSLYDFPKKIIKIKGNLENSIKENLIKGKTALLCDKYVRSLLIKKINIDIFDEQILFCGECCPEEFRKIFLFLQTKKIKNLIASGGGKVLDIAKYLKKNLSEINLINIPTSAATCAAFTPVSVIYNKDGSYLSIIDTISPDVLIIDYEFFIDLPFIFFAAGIIDTITKFYETDIFYKNEKKKIFSDYFTRDLLLILKKNIMKIIRKNKKDFNEKERIFLTDCNIIYSGLASCVGIKTVTSSIAHCLAHAMTAIKSSCEYLHGEHIAASVIIQEELLKNKRNINEIENILSKIDLPQRLSDIGIQKKDLDLLYKKYIHIKQNEKIYIPVNDDLMYNIIEKKL